MGTTKSVRVISVSLEPPVLTLETSWFPDQPLQVHVVPIEPADFRHFQAALTSRPFGTSPHVVSVESVSSAGSTYRCTVRVASGGSCQSSAFEICANTHAAIQVVFDSNIISEGYFPA